MTQLPDGDERGGPGRLLLVLVVGVGVAYLLGRTLRGRIDDSGRIALGLVILILGGFIARKLLRGGE